MDIDEFLYYLFSDGDFNFLWIIVVVFFVLFGCLHIPIFRSMEDPTAKRLMKGYAVFLIVYGLSRIFFIFANYYYEYGMEDTSAFMLHTRCAYILGLCSMAILIYGLERFLLPTKGLVTIFPIFAIILVIFLPYDFFRIFSYFIMPFYIVLILTFYASLLRKTTGDVHIRARNASLAILITFTGVFLDTRLFKGIFTDIGLRWMVFLFAPILCIIGCLFVYSANNANLKN